ncbi:unnamed protein product [Lepeophtheirus salmonis]|uniref:(salmon louse) hypothetical protein n=1 Tax=Lepeophtheirus salmonis TaxID=72036 RepID=A0A817FF67_LEPSM|nr:unnamed protein product [Lepeophtheirus salmonis]
MHSVPVGFFFSPKQKRFPIWKKAIPEGNESIWDFVASQNVFTIDPNEIIASLACSKNASIIEKYLNMTRENQIFNSSANIVYDKVCETQIGRSAFIDFLKVEFDQIMTS